jgi:hypothetical protein
VISPVKGMRKEKKTSREFGEARRKRNQVES